MTPEHLDYLAQKAANWTWGFLIVGGIVWWLTSIWWAIPFVVLAVWFGASSIAATLDGQRLRKLENEPRPEA